jgi:hypothetical protein
MNGSVESALRLLNLTAAGLLAGSLGFGEAALVPGWEAERPRDDASAREATLSKYFNAIGPIALATGMTLAIGARNKSVLRRTLDAASAVSLAGVLGTTMLVTVPINRRLDNERPIDYPDEESASMVRNYSRAHALRTALGISAFICAAASNVLRKR